ncbi:MAG: EVE domain-containing protein [Candidatus Gastranaerophilales bacterium]|nr:EVE domain-containing protein [Candidatus Gastranaerophilales bacterium]
MSEAKNAWIIVANRENMSRVAMYGVFGLNRCYILPKVRVGDYLVAYIKKEVSFSGIGQVTKEYYLDDTPIFDGGLFPDRIGVSLQLLPAKNSINAWKVVDELEFSKGKMGWQGSLVGGIRKIPVEDFKIIQKNLN